MSVKYQNNPGLNGPGILWLLFSLFILYGTLIPFNIVPNRTAVISNISHISRTPFVDPDGSRASIPDVVQNILFFTPFGFLGVFSIAGRRKDRPVFKAVILGILLSAVVEVLQLFTIDRTTSLTDLTTNAAGTLVGAFAGLVVLRASAEWQTSVRFRRFRQDKYFILLLIACAVVAAGALQPFDFTLDISHVGSKVRAILNNPLAHSQTLTDEGVVLFRFILFGFVCSLWLKKRGVSFYAPFGLVLGSVFGLILEASQIIVQSRMPGVVDAAIVVFGSAIGALMTELPLAKAPRILWAVLAVLLTGMTAGVQVLSPFHLRSVAGGLNWVPFLAYYERTTFIALSNFIESMLMYFPMGFILRYLYSRSNRTIVFFTVGVLSLIISFSLEFIQSWIEGRYADVTDVMGAVTGALLGVWFCSLWLAAFRQK